MMKLQFACGVCQYIPWGAFSALRVFALSQKNWVLSAIVFILSLGPVVVNLVVYGYGLRGQNIAIYGCQELNNATEPVEGEMLSAVSRSSLILADTLVIAVTLTKAWNGSFLFDSKSRISSLATVLVYDGTRYYVVLLILNMLEVIMVHFSNTPILPGISYITQISEPLTSIFISRFLLDLQAANQATRELNSQWSPGVSLSLGDNPGALVFASLPARSVGALSGLHLDTLSSRSPTIPVGGGLEENMSTGADVNEHAYPGIRSSVGDVVA
ncbi:hypothetical protein C8Q78DRAFT_373326 [Trametes maxima]|nr:hypothetical protein C8Q78DRAFT_373326 [Trametes maxima]